ncbi:MAG: hypothetical protein DMD49_05215 [Gemmatimonadetes bacterium]|nr:MAG: hypothetical protein DMD49_05215 [Gemmatimonadota bacterium]
MIEIALVRRSPVRAWILAGPACLPTNSPLVLSTGASRLVSRLAQEMVALTESPRAVRAIAWARSVSSTATLSATVTSSAIT